MEMTLVLMVQRQQQLGKMRQEWKEQTYLLMMMRMQMMNLLLDERESLRRGDKALEELE